MIELRTARLRMRPVCADDLEPIAKLGEDARVMTMLGGAMTRERTAAWLETAIAHWHDHAMGRFFVTLAALPQSATATATATATAGEGAFVGLVGLSRTDLDAGIIPGVEVAWRLVFDHWGHGYATEAARAAIDDGFERVGLRAITAITTPHNVRSRRVMERLGMVESPSESFDHPHLPEGSPLRRHVVYWSRYIPPIAPKPIP